MTPAINRIRGNFNAFKDGPRGLNEGLRLAIPPSIDGTRDLSRASLKVWQDRQGVNSQVGKVLPFLRPTGS